MTRRILLLLSSLLLVASACSGDEPMGDTTTSIVSTTTGGDSTEIDTTGTDVEPESDPLVTIVTTTQFDAETGEPVDVEEAVGPTTYEDLLESGIDAGLWNELDGLELLLGHAVGAVRSEEVPGVDFLETREFTHLLERAHALSVSDEHSDEDLAPVRRWYELAVPSAETMDLLGATSINAAEAAPEVAFNAQAASYKAQATDCAPIDPADFSGWGVAEGCYRLWSEDVQGVTVRVFYPAWYEDDDFHSGLPLAAGQAIVQSINTFAGFAPVGDIDAIFSLVDTMDSGGTLAVANHDGTWGQASRGGACPVTLFPNGFDSGFENTLAHEAWHCVQREMGFPRGVGPGTGWFREGGAQYFANLVFPETDWVRTFDSRSRTVPLYDMKYEAWVWWQFLGSREGPAGVAQLHKAMSDAGDGGIGLMAGRGEQFERFAIEYIAGAIEGPVAIPPARRLNTPSKTVSKNDAGTDVEFATSQFTVARYLVKYDQELRVLESDMSPGDVRMAMVEKDDRRSPDAWREVFPEIRSKCSERSFYVVAATSETPASQSGTVRIDTIEEADCDPCVLGTWRLDLESFEAMIKSLMGGALPSGSDFQISDGAYYLAFGEEGEMQEQRDGLTITVTSQGFALDMVIDSFGTGDYSADGENIGVTNLVDLFVNVNVGGFGGGNFDSGDSRALSGSGTYVCTNDDLVITTPEGTTSWDRVDKILTPPPLDNQE